MAVTVIRADARDLPLPDACVDLLVTSPPYFGLRSYTDNVKCLRCTDMEREGRDLRQAWPDYGAHVREVHIRHYDGQIGSEATPGEYVAALVACTREWVRVLKPAGSLFVNLGDKYASGDGSGNQAGLGPGGAFFNGGDRATRTRGHSRRKLDLGASRPKSLLGLPWRYALAATDQLGLILRAEIIWAKPNGLPESVTDRVRRAHEQVFHFVLRPRYYSAVDEIREPQTGVTGGRDRRPFESGNGLTHRSGNKDYDLYNPLGKLPGSVWNIPSQPLTVPPHLGVDHFAAFPMELPRRIIAGWSPPGVCTACGEGRRPVADKQVNDTQRTTENRSSMSKGTAVVRGVSRKALEVIPRGYDVTVTGYACACHKPPAGAVCSDGSRAPAGPPTRPAVILGPFGGTGTTALLASALGRHGITIDRSADYCRLAAWRTSDPGERARALEVPKPPPVIDGQDTLFAFP